MKVLVIDNLTETFKGSIVRSGLQKSSKLDARAFSKYYDTTYMYCGKILDEHYNYNHFIIDELGAKDRAIIEKNNSKLSAKYIRKYLGSVRNDINKYDFIICHCHSLTMFNSLNEICDNKKIIFIIHDVIDLMWASGFSSAVKKMKSKLKNNCKILTNSNYSIQRYVSLYNRRKKIELLKTEEIFDGFIKHFVWTDIVPDVKTINEKVNETAIIGRYEANKYHSKLYGYENKNNTIVHYGIKDPVRDKDFKYYERLKEKSNCYRENLSDEDLFNNVSKSKSIVLPCFHEGFGYTAFEAGIFGVVPVILQKELNGNFIHATSEYLTRANVKHFTCDFSNKEDIFEKINLSLDVSLNERYLISKRLLDYFSLEKYVEERIGFFNKKEYTKPKVTDRQISLF